jgi:hypothetical protein
MDNRSYVLTRNTARLAKARRNTYSRALTRDATLQHLIADLVAARTAAGMTQEDVAFRMLTTKSTATHVENDPTLCVRGRSTGRDPCSSCALVRQHTTCPSGDAHR